MLHQRICNKIRDAYFSYWCPRFFFKKYDGGQNSGVTGYFLVEWKPVFSIGLLHFKNGTRDAYHNHAFHAITFWLKGLVIERFRNGDFKVFQGFSIKPKVTLRSDMHMVESVGDSWALTLRSPWQHEWVEVRKRHKVTLTHGRKEVKSEDI